jgi:predicted RNase H-like HicB family nuclease
MRTYTVILEPEPGGGFAVLVPVLPEVVTEGDTEEDLTASRSNLRMAEDAMRLALEYRKDQGLEIPKGDAPRG